MFAGWQLYVAIFKIGTDLPNGQTMHDGVGIGDNRQIQTFALPTITINEPSVSKLSAHYA